MPANSGTRKDFGNGLNTAPGVKQPTGTFDRDAYGLVQAQLTYSLDSADTVLASMLNYFKTPQAYPYTLSGALSDNMKSYRVHVSLTKGGLANVVVDYMGIDRTGGISDANIQGVVATTGQPIQTHPNFTAITDTTIGTADHPLAGKPNSTYASSTPNRPIFLPISADSAGINTSTVQRWEFKGFGVSTTDTPNKKAGVTQFLRPQTTVRGVIYIAASFSTFAGNITKNVGRRLDSTALSYLIPSSIIAESMNPDLYLLTHAGMETIGNANTGSSANTVAYKITYDVMYGGKIGWDADIYGSWQA
jgi:hypothetical protein